MIHLSPGKHVNIVLKADQRTGNLTAGQIADVLTRGDHPRGIKVRLKDGQIGRVQSLSSSQSQAAAQTTESNSGQQSSHMSHNSSLSTQNINNRWKMTQDMRYDGHDPEARSDIGNLADYIKPCKQKRGRKVLKSQESSGAPDTITHQERLEKDFPWADTALIAAILVDYPDVNNAREIIDGLSEQ